MHTFTYIYIHTHTYMHKYMHTCIHAYMYACIRAYIYTYTYTYTYMHTYVRTYTHTYRQTYICTCIDTIKLPYFLLLGPLEAGTRNTCCWGDSPDWGSNPEGELPMRLPHARPG